MKLAEALIARADLKQRIAQLQARIIRNAKVQEGDAPSEDPNELLAEFKRLVDEYETMIGRINRTNLSATLDDGTTLTRAIASRDAIMLRISTYRKLAEEATVSQTRGLRTEVKFLSAVPVRQIQDEADRLSRQHRELDARIQAANWTSDLLD
jgi:hypothetical protein